MPVLPAITFLGLRGTAAWLALAGGAAGAYVVLTRALPALAPRSSGAGARAAAPQPGATAAELIGLLRAASESSARVATSALGPGASLGVAGIGVARDVTGALERFAEQQTRAITQTSTELIRSRSAENLAIIQLAQRPPAPVAVTSIPPVAVARSSSAFPVMIGPPPAAAETIPFAVPSAPVALPPPVVSAPQAPAPSFVGDAPIGSIIRQAVDPGVFIVRTESGGRLVTPSSPLVRTGTSVNTVGLTGDALTRYVAELSIRSGDPARIAHGERLLAEIGG